jgi:methylglyoxal synthase
MSAAEELCDKNSLDPTHRAEGAFLRATAQRALGFVASASLRKVKPEETNRIYAFVKNHIEVLSSYFVYATAGTYKDVFWDRVSQGTDWSCELPIEGHRLRNGKEGGIIQLAALVEHRKPRNGESATEVAGPVRTLLFLLHPEDHEELYPEDQALLRAAIRNNTLILTTLESAEQWARWESSGPNLAPREDHRGEEIVALIAHDRMKLQICKWAVRHRKALSTFKSIVTTGTTGKLVHEFLEAADIKAGLIEPRFSGPEGGDIQIADLILREGCQHVIFFVDPTTAHPHEADIRALVRICSLPDVKVNLRLTECAASSWITSYASPAGIDPSTCNTDSSFLQTLGAISSLHSLA